MARPDAEMLLRLACRQAKEAQFSSSTFVLHVAAVRQHGMRNAVQQGLKVGGKFALVTAGVAALGFGAARTTAVVIDKRERGRFLESVRSAELPEDVVAEIAAALSAEISRAVDESVAPLLKLVS